MIIEIGSGFSTLVALEAIIKNEKGRIISIEPYPSDWLKAVKDIELIEKRAQELNIDFFNQNLSKGDVLEFLEVKSAEECLEILYKYYPKRLIEQKSIYFIEEIFDEIEQA